MMRGALAVAVACLGCEATATEIVVVVDSDLQPGTELVAVLVQTDGDSHQFPITSADDLPLSLGLVPGPGQPDDAPVRLAVMALDADGEPLVDALVLTTFRPEERRVLPVPLARSCVPVEDCADRAADQTCRDGECASAVVDSSTLAEGDGSGVRLFDGPSSGDAGVELGDMGPECVVGSECVVEGGCASGAQVCDPEPECADLIAAPAGSDCGDGRTCDGAGLCIGR